MNQLNLFIELTRLKKPIGYMLLFWPCAWGLTIAYDFSNDLNTYFFYLLLFFLGSVLMRSAGCIVNDILDRKFDKKVSRTKNRPIASGKISVALGLFYATTLCLLAFLVLITFNYGLILGWSSISNEISLIPVIFYFGAIFWTLGYDTIYGYQDIKDDEIIGLKSTSIKFKSNPYMFLNLCYLIFAVTLLVVGYLMKFDNFYFLFWAIIIFQMFYIQVYKFNYKVSSSCLRAFKSNNSLGLLIFLSLIISQI